MPGRQGDRLGLILFGTQAYLQAPLTFDPAQTAKTWLEEALIGIAGKNTAIGDAIGLAVKRLRERPAQSRVLVLVTDGANTAGEIEPLNRRRLAAEAGENLHHRHRRRRGRHPHALRHASAAPGFGLRSGDPGDTPNSPAGISSRRRTASNWKRSMPNSTGSNRPNVMSGPIGPSVRSSSGPPRRRCC